jgi:hypothetical protein
LLDDAEEYIADIWHHRLGGKVSNAICLFAIMAGEFYRRVRHGSQIRAS